MKIKKFLLRIPMDLWDLIKEFQFAAKLDYPHQAVIELLKIALEMWKGEK